MTALPEEVPAQAARRSFESIEAIGFDPVSTFISSRHLFSVKPLHVKWETSLLFVKNKTLFLFL